MNEAASHLVFIFGHWEDLAWGQDGGLSLWQLPFCVWAAENAGEHSFLHCIAVKDVRESCGWFELRTEGLERPLLLFIFFFLKKRCQRFSSVVLTRQTWKISPHLLHTRQLCRPRDPFAFHSSLASIAAYSVKAMITLEGVGSFKLGPNLGHPSAVKQQLCPQTADQQPQHRFSSLKTR